MRRTTRVLAALVLGVLLVSACGQDAAGPTKPLEDAATAMTVDASGVRQWTVVTPTGGWSITQQDLPKFARCLYENGEATAINESGWVVGHALAPTEYGGCVSHAFLFRPGQRLRDLTRSANDAVANDVNNLGEVVGTADGRPFRWSSSSGLRYLPTLGGGTGTATAINDAGRIVGTSTTASGAVHAVIWSRSGGIHDLAPMTEAWAVSDVGAVAGAAVYAAGQPSHAVTWERGQIRDYGTSGVGAAATGLGMGGGDYLAVVGTYQVGANSLSDSRAFFSPSAGAGFIAIPTLGGAANTALGFNGTAVVGWSWTLETEPGLNATIEAYYWSSGSGTLRLSQDDPPGFYHAAARGVNGVGQVVGWRTHPLGLDRLPVLWTVTPLP